MLGSSAQCDLCVSASGVSRRHLSIEVLADGGVIVEDLGSSNGTRFGQRKIQRIAITEPTRLRAGELELSLHPDSESARLVALPEMDTTRASGAAHRAPSMATDLPNKAWALIPPIEAALSQRGRGEQANSVLAQLLAEWSSLLKCSAICVREDRPDAPVAAAFGDFSSSAQDFSQTIREAGFVLEIRVSESRELTVNQILALRIGLSALAPTGAALVKPETDIVSSPAASTGLIGASIQMRELYALASRVATGRISVLIRGESGSGKELLAHLIHRQSARRHEPFLAINCAALPEDLLEAEIFGIERGIATGVDARAGLLERARGGTIFLDELGDMAAATQAKILRALESNQIYRVGGSRPIEIDVRFVSATHRDLHEQIAQGNFRLDLYHRLAAVELIVPPLRERREDIPLLATHFLAGELATLDRSSPGITDAAMATLCGHDWPGNVRELRNEMARAALMLNAHQALGTEHLSGRLKSLSEAKLDLSLSAALDRAEQEAFAIALAAARNDHAKAMEFLQVSRSSFFRRLRSFRGQDIEGGPE